MIYYSLNVWKDVRDSAWESTVTWGKWTVAWGKWIVCGALLRLFQFATSPLRALKFLERSFCGSGFPHKAVYQRLDSLSSQQASLSEFFNRYSQGETTTHFLIGELKILTEIQPALLPHLSEITRGAHVRLEDGGVLYDRWKSCYDKIDSRISSHKGMDTALGHCLFGQETVEDEATGQSSRISFFQFERTPLLGICGYMWHTDDYLRYQMTGEQQGPAGNSRHTDKNPLTFSFNAQQYLERHGLFPEEPLEEIPAINDGD